MNILIIGYYSKEGHELADVVQAGFEECGFKDHSIVYILTQTKPSEHIEPDGNTIVICADTPNFFEEMQFDAVIKLRKYHR